MRDDALVQPERNELGRPLWKGPLIGGAYLLAGVVVGAGAWWLGGWLAVPLWIIAGLLVLAGAWTALFTGFFLTAGVLAERKSRRSGTDPE